MASKRKRNKLCLLWPKKLREYIFRPNTPQRYLVSFSPPATFKTAHFWGTMRILILLVFLKITLQLILQPNATFVLMNILYVSYEKAMRIEHQSLDKSRLAVFICNFGFTIRNLTKHCINIILGYMHIYIVYSQLKPKRSNKISILRNM